MMMIQVGFHHFVVQFGARAPHNSQMTRFAVAPSTGPRPEVDVQNDEVGSEPGRAVEVFTRHSVAPSAMISTADGLGVIDSSTAWAFLMR